MQLVKTKTFWGGVLAVLTSIFFAVFGESETPRPLGEIARALLSDPKLWVGLSAITVRSAIARVASQLLALEPTEPGDNGPAPVARRPMPPPAPPSLN